jgi:hypothetical protein
MSPRPRAFERHFHRLDGDALIFTTITKGRAWPPPQRRQLALTGWLALEGAWYFGSDGEPQPAPHHLPHSMRHTSAPRRSFKGEYRSRFPSYRCPT